MTFLLSKTEIRLIQGTHTATIDCCALWKLVCFKISLFVLNDSAANVEGGHINNFETLIGKTVKWSGVEYMKGSALENV